MHCPLALGGSNICAYISKPWYLLGQSFVPFLSRSHEGLLRPHKMWPQGLMEQTKVQAQGLREPTSESDISGFKHQLSLFTKLCDLGENFLAHLNLSLLISKIGINIFASQKCCKHIRLKPFMKYLVCEYPDERWL